MSYNRKRIKANKMMTGKNVMNSGIEQKINHAMEGMQKELQQKKAGQGLKNFQNQKA